MHSRLGKATIQVAPARKRPIQKNFERPPVWHPAQDQEALFHQAPERKLSQITAYYMRRNEACDQNSNADREPAAANAKKLVEVALEKIGAVGEYLAKASPSSRVALV